jgi:hypothetical protein
MNTKIKSSNEENKRKRIFSAKRRIRKTQFNRNCLKCIHSCKQSFKVIIIACPCYKDKENNLNSATIIKKQKTTGGYYERQTHGARFNFN